MFDAKGPMAFANREDDLLVLEVPEQFHGHALHEAASHLGRWTSNSGMSSSLPTLVTIADVEEGCC